MLRIAIGLVFLTRRASQLCHPELFNGLPIACETDNEYEQANRLQRKYGFPEEMQGKTKIPGRMNFGYTREFWIHKTGGKQS